MKARELVSIRTHIANLLHSSITQKSLPVCESPYKALHALIYRFSLFHDTFLCNRLIQLSSKSGDINSAALIFDLIPNKNSYSWTAMISAWFKNDYAEYAFQVFDEMPDKDVLSWNTTIGGLLQGGYDLKGLCLYSDMNREGLMASEFTLASVISACGKLGDLRLGRQCHGQVVRIGFVSVVYVQNALVCLYSKCGCVRDAFKVIEGMYEPNEVSFTALMSGLAMASNSSEAFEVFRKMHGIGVHIDEVALSCVLGICSRNYGRCVALDLEQVLEFTCGIEKNNDMGYETSRIEQGRMLHGFAIRTGYDLDILVANCLIDMYSKSGTMTEAELVFEAMSKRNVVSWNMLIAGYGQRGQGEKAVETMKLMQEEGFIPDEVTYGSVLNACVKLEDMEMARMIFYRITSPSLTSWNVVIVGYFHGGGYGEALDLFRQMQFAKTRPDRTTISVVLGACTGLGLLPLGRQVHAMSLKDHKLQFDVFVSSGLIDMYSTCGKIDHAKLVFVRMTERDVALWNSMISGLSFHSLHNDAFMLFKQMREEGFQPSRFSYASVLGSCARMASLDQGRQVHAQTVKDGFVGNVIVGSALIDVYAKSGSLGDSRRFFDTMVDKNLVSWNEMINAYAQSAAPEEAIELFAQMLRSKLKPDGVTFVSVLSACSHAGLADESLRFLNSMESKHGILPSVDHYACVVDALGRGGRLEEAETLICMTSYKDDPSLLGVLLGACTVYSNLGVGRRVAQRLLEIESHNPAPYVLLANIYAGLGRFEDATKVQRLMGKRGILKDQAYSWIESKN